MKTSTAAVAVGAYTVGAFVAYRVLKSARDADADSVAHWLASSVKKSSTTTLLSHLREAFGVTSAPTADDAGGVTGRERDVDAAGRIVDGEAGESDDTPAEEAAVKGREAPLAQPRALLQRHAEEHEALVRH